MATKAQKLPSGRWRVRVQVPSTDGKQHYKSFTADTRKEAEYTAARFALTVQNELPSARLTVGKAIERYIDTRTAVLSPSTIRSYRNMLKSHFDSLREVALTNLTNDMAQVMVNNLSANLSPKTVRNVVALLTSALKAYYPAYKLTVHLPQKVRHEMHIPDAEEVHALISDTEGKPIANAILLAAAYGLRRSEICALTWHDIDERRLTLTVNKALVKNSDYQWETKPPKSYAGTRTISVAQSVIDRLKANKHDDERVCPLNPDSLTLAFIRLTDRMQIDIRFHDLRHYNASVMLAHGVPDKYAMERLGQSTPSMLKNVYQHIMKDKREQVNETMNAIADEFAK